CARVTNWDEGNDW
nr:immunoglobulin heavy chain junction region [Mus musculus]